MPPEVLAAGPWRLEQVTSSWRSDPFEPADAVTAAADAAIAELVARGSPSHDGPSARVADWRVTPAGLHLDLQPIRWALRLTGDGLGSLAALCVTRDAQGRWLAGRRAPWVASWPGRWALGAAGAVEVGEHPPDTLARELVEEWSVTPERLDVRALVRGMTGTMMLVGMAWLAEGAEVVPDHEHDDYAWWPADVADWPVEAHTPLRMVATLLSA